MKPLTKSRFKTALECPNKLFFTSKKEYPNNKSDDPFMQALAKGGFQVEEIFSNKFMWTKLDYIHLNPVRSGLVENASI
jgi:hypothetical protein